MKITPSSNMRGPTIDISAASTAAGAFAGTSDFVWQDEDFIRGYFLCDGAQDGAITVDLKLSTDGVTYVDADTVITGASAGDTEVTVALSTEDLVVWEIDTQRIPGAYKYAQIAGTIAGSAATVIAAWFEAHGLKNERVTASSTPDVQVGLS